MARNTVFYFLLAFLLCCFVGCTSTGVPCDGSSAQSTGELSRELEERQLDAAVTGGKIDVTAGELSDRLQESQEILGRIGELTAGGERDIQDIEELLRLIREQRLSAFARLAEGDPGTEKEDDTMDDYSYTGNSGSSFTSCTPYEVQN